ncbi:MAG: hypothetical protein Q9186_003083 [Xanthomendoza sp. 1 TL-2023]
MINSVLARLASAAGLDDKQWEVYHLDAPTGKKAIFLSNGQVMVHSGLFHTVTNEDELAALLSFAIASEISKHSEESEARQSLLNAISGPLQLLTLFSNLQGLIFISKIGLWTTEANYFSLLLMTEAGFNPEGHVSLQRKLIKQSAFEICSDPKAEAQQVDAHILCFLSTANKSAG